MRYGLSSRSFRSHRFRRTGALLASACAAAWFATGVPARAAGAQGGDQKIDVALVLAVDVSWSMDTEEQRIQRDGYAAAFRSKEVIDAIREGGYGRVAVTYVEWAGSTMQLVVVPWTIIDDEAGSQRFADALSMQEPAQLRRTSISGAIDFSSKLLDKTGMTPMRRVIDISGDGPNNEGRPVTEARDEAVARGITINGLPLMTSARDGFGYSIENLDDYYGDCVVGGGQSFVIPVTSWKEFPEAIRRKLVLELAGTPTERAAYRAPHDFPVIEVADENAGKAGADCMIGEKIWRKRWERWNQ
ncbi:DUF1194 domain-containing protein [Pararhizobium mangrovi]|uniref:DUF1194 domain-containing protein n=2 Tax=Pararhizobium mangrovi TaxID=2590452 RepID=A0A506UFL2_9HYPH|nr:DUF1194 domain-containing protein [Pararhizobium mangrovi]